MNLLFNRCNTEYFNPGSEDAYFDFQNCVKKRLSLINENALTPVILCIGTDRATGDCLGPLVGEKLLMNNINADIYGTLATPIHAMNLIETINVIEKKYANSFVIAIDAALGPSSYVGYVTVSDCPMSPGKGVGKKLPAIGDLSITGIVNMSGRNESVLHSTRLYTVMHLADFIADALMSCLL